MHDVISFMNNEKDSLSNPTAHGEAPCHLLPPQQPCLTLQECLALFGVEERSGHGNCAYFLPQEQTKDEDALELGDDEWDDVAAAIAGGAMLRVTRIESGFEIVLRLKNKERSEIRLHTSLRTGGLYTAKGYPILHAYEFSMHSYQSHANLRPATEYVRRKLAKEKARVDRARKWIGF